MTIDDTHIRRLTTSILEGAQDEPQSAEAIIARFSFVQLRPHLISLLGTGGFHMLVSHALTRAQLEVAWLRHIRSKGDGSFEGLDDAYARTTPGVFKSGSGIVLTHLISLLVQFIGADMTLAVMKQSWPKAPIPDTETQGAD